jgi:hypothetical protein
MTVIMLLDGQRAWNSRDIEWLLYPMAAACAFAASGSDTRSE